MWITGSPRSRTGSFSAAAGVSDREFRDQLLDSMDLERERGITIKSNSVSLLHETKEGEKYQLNLIDTPGHVDFSHEVRRSLMSCEGALLLVDAAQGVEAQTVANHFVAMEYDLAVVPVINKIDLPAADPERVREEIDDELGLDPFEVVLASAKKGEGIEEILDAIVHRIPASRRQPRRTRSGRSSSTRSTTPSGEWCWLVRVVDGEIRPGDRVRLMRGHREYRGGRGGTPAASPGTGGRSFRGGGGIRNLRDQADPGHCDRRHGDRRGTAPRKQRSRGTANPGRWFSVRCTRFQPTTYGGLENALGKLALNDPALTYERESSTALGFGFRCGFLGLLHLDVVQERLRREHGLSLLLSAPSVRYRITTRDGELHEVENPAHYPDPAIIAGGEEPYIRASILIPERSVGVGDGAV